jgi:hypothetical protein
MRDGQCRRTDGLHNGKLHNSPVRVPVIVMRLADLQAKPDANHANPHPHVSLLVSDSRMKRRGVSSALVPA